MLTQLIARPSLAPPPLALALLPYSVFFRIAALELSTFAIAKSIAPAALLLQPIIALESRRRVPAESVF